ncbi:hypothetical protein ACHHYP_13754 [Achlya hypogyna]|uniref:Uncharacterized protein n=1 Tax=Achlya hypogyna TaxID=1202772 RepID=A0A1V9ZFD2_ACHHY|nr:hypothetical protein ACHHYP_13754 [Achlya hypogyna]
MASARFVTAHGCCKEELFRSDYIRTNKAGGLKSLRLVYFFRHVPGAQHEIECIDAIQSRDFHIRSSRVVRKKTRLERANAASPVDADELQEELTCSSSSSELKAKSAPRPRKRDLLCLLNPNSPRVAAKVARLESVSPPSITGRALPPLLGLSSLVQRSNDVYFIVQVLSRIADFHSAGATRKYFSLTPFHFFFVKSLTLELPLSCPRITCGSPMEALLSVLVAGVTGAIERGFLAKLRDYVMRHPRDVVQAYSDFLGFFEAEILEIGRQFPTPCTSIPDLVETVATTFAAELGEKYKDLLPDRTYATEPSVDALYLGKELAAALAASSTSPQWSPTLKNNAFSSLTGKWTRLSLQCRMQPQRHPSWLYRLLTDVASRIWSIDDRGDEMLILWPGSVGTSHIIHKLCGKHRPLGQSPYGLRSECTQLVGYLGKRNFRDNTVTLEYYYWPAANSDASSMRKRLTRHFRTHPDHPHLLEIHNVLEVCKVPDNEPIDRLNHPGDWRLESSSMDTYERTP